MVTDKLEQMRFMLDKRSRIEAQSEVEACTTFEQYFALGASRFGLTQRPSEISSLISLAKTINPRIVCEIGTQYGGNLFLMGNCLPSVCEVYGVDLYVRNREKLRAMLPGVRSLHTLSGSSYSQRIFEQVRAALGDKKIDLLFIDGDHSYEGAKQDFVLYRSLVAEGGLIGFHDIVPDHKTRFGKVTLGYSGGVPILWERVATMFKSHEFIEDPMQDSLGIGVIEHSRSVELPADL